MKKGILVVDDEIGIRLLLKEMFASKGYQVITAPTGKEALREINRNKIELIIIDYKLPIMDGIEVLKQLAKDNIFIPTILMSGLIESARSELEGLPFVKATMAKPFNISELYELVDSLLKTEKI